MLYAKTPYHKGKGRLVKFAADASGLESILPSKVTVKRKGIDLELDLKSYFGKGIYLSGSYDAWETRFVETILKPDWTFFDVGANIGWFSLIASKIIDSAGQIHAFEISPEEYTLLRRNIDLNKNANIIPYALGLSDSSGDVWITEKKGAGTTRIAVSEEEKKYAVKVMSFDDFIAKKDLKKIDFIKVDIEGAEKRFLIGAQQSIMKHQPIMMFELSESNFKAFNTSIDEIVSLLKEHGYMLYRITSRGLVKFTDIPEDHSFFNVACLHNTLSVHKAKIRWHALKKIIA